MLGVHRMKASLYEPALTPFPFRLFRIVLARFIACFHVVIHPKRESSLRKRFRPQQNCCSGRRHIDNAARSRSQAGLRRLGGTARSRRTLQQLPDAQSLGHTPGLSIATALRMGRIAINNFG